jgi:hypothetical protein
VAVERWCNGGGELLIAQVLESGRELESKGERCGGGWGWCSHFIGVGERRVEAAMASLMALTPLMAGKG